MSEQVGDLIKKAKTAAGLIQADLAKAVEGFATSDAGKAERGKEAGSPDPLEVAKGDEAASKSQAATDEAPSAPKEAAKSAEGEAPLTADEKALLTLYRAANADTRKVAKYLLKSEKQLVPGVMSMFAGLIKNGGVNSENPLAKMMDVGGPNGDNPFSGMLGPLMGMMSGLLTKKGDSENQDVPTPDSLMVFTYLYSVSIYILMLSYYFWQIRTDIKPEQPESSQSEQSEQKK